MSKAVHDRRADGALLDVSVRPGCSKRVLSGTESFTGGTALVGGLTVGLDGSRLAASPATLPGRRPVTPGKPMIGAVTVSPLHTGTTRSARLELIPDEHVPARPCEPLEEDCDARPVIAVVTPRWASS